MEEEWKEAGTGLYMVVNVSASIALEVGKMSLIEGLVVYDFSSAWLKVDRISLFNEDLLTLCVC